MDTELLSSELKQWGAKFTARLQLVPVQSTVELYLHSPYAFVCVTTVYRDCIKHFKLIT